MKLSIVKAANELPRYSGIIIVGDKVEVLFGLGDAQEETLTLKSYLTSLAVNRKLSPGHLDWRRTVKV